MSKYIIEIEDEPFVRLSALFGEEGLYRAKGFNSLVFDQFGLDKLTPLDKALDEAYQKGVHEGSLDVKERVEGAYQKGYEVGQHEATTLEYQQGLEEGKKQARAQAHLDVCHDIERVAHGNYQQGLDDAWECMKAIAFLNKPRDMRDFFGCSTLGDVLIDYTASEAIEKLKSYEEQQKADEIKVGDEVRNTLGLMDNAVGYFIGTTIEGDYNVSRYIDGRIKTGTWRRENCVKTGKHSYAVERMIEVMKGGAE